MHNNKDRVLNIIYYLSYLFIIFDESTDLLEVLCSELELLDVVGAFLHGEQDSRQDSDQMI